MSNEHSVNVTVAIEKYAAQLYPSAVNIAMLRAAFPKANPNTLRGGLGRLVRRGTLEPAIEPGYYKSKKPHV